MANKRHDPTLAHLTVSWESVREYVKKYDRIELSDYLLFTEYSLSVKIRSIKNGKAEESKRLILHHRKKNSHWSQI